MIYEKNMEIDKTSATLFLIVSPYTSLLIVSVAVTYSHFAVYAFEGCSITSDLICLLDATAVIPSLVYLKLFFSLCRLVIFSANTLQAAVSDTALIRTDTSDIACVAVYSQSSQPGDKVVPPLL